MNEHLEKARAALADAKACDTTDPRYRDLLRCAEVQAQLAQAASLERIAEKVDLFTDLCVGHGGVIVSG